MNRLAVFVYYAVYVPTYVYFSWNTIFNLSWDINFIDNTHGNVPIGFIFFLRGYIFFVTIVFLIWLYRYGLKIYTKINIATMLWFIGLVLIVLNITLLFP